MIELLKSIESNQGLLDTILKIGLLIFLPFLSIQIGRGIRWIKDVNFRVIAVNHAIKEVLANGNKEQYTRKYNEKYEELKENYKFIMKGE